MLADVVAPIRYAVRGGALAADLRRYKSGRCGAAEAALAAERLRQLLAGFLDGHGGQVWRAAGMPAGPAAVAVVPSGQGRPGAHPLAGLVRDCVRLPPVRLSLRSGEIHRRGVSPGWLRVHTPVSGGDILVVDDTWVSGGSAQSTAAALKLAGARRVAIVVLGRHVNPDHPRSAAFLDPAGEDFSAWCPPEPGPFVLKAGQLPERRTETAVQYALLIYTKPGTVEALSPKEVEELSRDYWALRDEPGILGGAGLQPVTTATTLRLADGKPVVTDGPFADTKEVFGGYYLYECDNLDQATEMAARIPVLRIGGTVEIRPVMGKAAT